MKEKIGQSVQFLKEAYSELRKVSWLSKKEVIGSTIVVIIFVFIIAIYVGLVDLILSRIVGIFVGGRT